MKNKNNVNNKKKKVSLLREIFSYNLFNSEKIENDEMIVHERNKITYTGLTILIATIIIFSIFADIFSLGEKTLLVLPVLSLVGLVKYIMLIAFCKKGIVRHAESWSSLLFGVFTLPTSFVCLALTPFAKSDFYIYLQPVLIILLIIVLYQIANIIYKKSQKEVD